MAKVRVTETEISFRCPACGLHSVPTGRWTLTGTVDNPTVTPSLVETLNAKDSKHHRPAIPTRVCHSKIDNGMIHFCDDCTHQFANQTLPLEDFP